MSLAQQQAPESAQVVQDAAAAVDVPGEAIELVGDELNRLEAPRGAFGLGGKRLGFDRSLAGLDGVAQQADVFEGIFDAVEGGALICYGVPPV